MLTAPHPPDKPSLSALQAHYDGPIPAPQRRAALIADSTRSQRHNRMVPAYFWRREARAVLADLKRLKHNNGGVTEAYSAHWEDRAQTFRVAWAAYRSVYARGRHGSEARGIFVPRR